jgi:hypothetical protein
MLSLEMLLSIHALSPLEEGGSVARTGFLYQDHVAARFCIQMLGDPRLTEVWCETEDDVTLLWDFGQGTVVEFVQVKANELDQLWSVSLLCGGGVADSIVAKSLAHDRCVEPCWFRVVTRADIHSDLRPLCLDREDQRRCLGNMTIRTLHAKVSKALGGALSPRGRSASHWLADTVWQVGESEQAISDNNRWKLQKYLEEKENEPLFTDQLQELYGKLVYHIINASCTKWREGGDKKKLRRDAFRNWLLSTVRRIKGHTQVKGGRNLRRKMTDAQIPAAAIDTADDLRHAYRIRTLTPKYLQEDNFKVAELEVAAVMQRLLSDLDAGNLTDNGRQFHARCLNELTSVRQSFPQVDTGFLQGVLYTATDRCRHRFLRDVL